MRRSVVSRALWMRRRGTSIDELAARLGVSRSTLIEWISRWEEDHLAPRPRGAVPRHATPQERRAVIEVLDREGLGVGVAELGRRLAGIARRELEEIVSSYSRWLARRGRDARYILEWTRPGTVWASDFTQTPGPVDGLFPKLELVRDLASGVQLEALPSTGESAAEVELLLTELFTVHGAPLVLKEDNGSGYIAEATRELCERHGVLILYSPPYTPQYNGSCEAGGGGMKARTRRVAAANGRAGEWTSDDVELARLQANHCRRARGPRGAAPTRAWDARRPITMAERGAFIATYRRLERAERVALGIPADAPLNRAEQAIIDRVAIAAALNEHDLLNYRRG